MKYESPSSNGSKVMGNVKVFVTDRQIEDGQMNEI